MLINNRKFGENLKDVLPLGGHKVGQAITVQDRASLRSNEKIDFIRSPLYQTFHIIV